jgi:geranylgeranyl pyrophosphate synthase
LRSALKYNSGGKVRETKKLIENMPDSLEVFYLDRIKMIKGGIAGYFPHSLDKAFYERISDQVELFDQDEDKVYESTFLPTQQYLDRGGKVLRPLLAALCLEAYGCDSSDYESFLGAIEVMEDSSIMMDDYIDNSLLRRGGHCAHVVHGNPIANLASCTAFALSHYIFYNNEMNLPFEKATRLINAVAWEHIQMAFGQIEELYWTESNINTVTVEQYLQETIARCAFLTFRGPLRYAAIIADAPEEDIPVLEKIGEYMLVGYHVRGDNLDMSPDSDAWGKIAGEDITTGRRTLLINYILQNASEEDNKRLVEIINSRTVDESRKREVFDLVMKYRGLEYTRDLAEKYNSLTKKEIDKLHVSDKHKNLFCQFSDFSCMKRAV